MDTRIARLVLNAETVVLEFEGVVTDATGGRFDVSKVLASLAKRFLLPISMIEARTTFELLGKLDANGTEVSEAGDVATSAIEAEAVHLAGLRPGARGIISLLRKSEKRVACVSRMSKTAVERFLADHGLSEQFNLITARPRALSHMIPQPHAFYTLLFQLHIKDPGSVLFIAWSDDAAQAAAKLRIPVVRLDFKADREQPRTADPAISRLVELAAPLGGVTLDADEMKAQRAIELKSKGSLHSDELLEYLVLTGGAKVVRNRNDMGFIDETVAQQNLAILEASRREAAGRNLVLEVYASTAILIEMELRMWLSVCHDRVFRVDDKHTLGQVIKDARQTGLDVDLAERLAKFVENRNIGIHRIIQGERKYFDLGAEYMRDPSLYEDLATWVNHQLPQIVDLAAGTWRSEKDRRREPNP